MYRSFGLAMACGSLLAFLPAAQAQGCWQMGLLCDGKGGVFQPPFTAPSGGSRSGDNETTLSNGLSGYTNGNTTVYSNGVTRYGNGNTDIYSNGRTCYTNGNTRLCN